MLTGVAEEPVLIQVLLALVHDLRHGLFVCLNGPEDLVIRCNDTVGQGRILLRTGDGDIEACDAEGLSGALSAIARAVPVVQARASYAASTMFADVQNRELAADAIRLMRVFTDPDFLRRADPGGDDPLYDPRWLVERNSLPRHFLDLLLLTHAMSPAAAGPGATRDGDHEGMTTAAAIASKVEVFVASSAAVESGTLARPLPDGGIGFLIALPALASEVMANLAWALPTLLAPARVAGFSSGDHDLLGARRALDDSLASYLASRRPRRSTAPLPTPRPVIPMAMPDTATPNGSDDPSVVFKASSLFLIARELVPILFGGSRAGVPGTRLPLSTAGLPKETRLEMWADQEAYGLTISALVAGSGEHEPYIPDFDNITRSLRSGRLPFFGRKAHLHERALYDSDLLLRCMNRATEALLSYYAVADIFAAAARADGQSLLARRLEAVAARRERACEYVWRTKRDHLPEAWGIRTWHEQEQAQWRTLQEYVRHVQLDVVPRVPAA
ncbi:hypothetical protein OG887_43815 (plasmid) [Streptomyces sp. NBC_00053]|uniref:hypothetical protein n=1 Tax=unclassified Streptomyces TaxID=2593676 RepID=UPI002258FA4E|nr:MULTISPECIES: hypothetical protein [unclassified Streptomyces]MCX4400189.1 hypothetical protein [Streptomyces sp. NBC_01767]MCX5106855.1 hypothetical protein [Streptomyces sp. NBC_00439]MCX5506234.1 hypothetical protein [Streptomyces sp. NBC_00052]MCX5554063.1 hypothetical protein [Streptomyces sp. NBC_00051]